MKLHYYILAAIALIAGLFSSCRDQDDIEEISLKQISKEYLQGGWRIVGSQVLWDLSVKGTSINGIYDFKKKIGESIAKETDCVSIYFANDTLAYYVRHLPTDTVPYFRQTKYSMTSDSAGFAICFGPDPEVMGFYAPVIYVKTMDYSKEVTFYLRRDEVLNMIRNNSESRSYASLISNEVNNAELALFAVRDTLDFYHDLDLYSGIIR
ncbi:MAG: hypothetical protein MJZ02_05045 [Paludibacteraceae bacterium]|nr:hypothetical protein [Paludibacteraceae bacterium]